VEKLQNKNDSEIPSMSTALAPEITEKLRKSGIDPDNFTMQQLFPATLDDDGNDLSLMSGAEWEIMITYAKTRKYLLEKYPQSHEEAQILGKTGMKNQKTFTRLTSPKHNLDPQRKVFVHVLFQMKAIYDKVEALQRNASDYEKICLCLYWHLTFNWKHAPNVGCFQEALHDCDIFEIVETYFKICRKYHLPTFEEPYDFLTEQRRLEIKLEGDILRRTTNYSDFEIHISILEELT
jgi:hypothetical protein